MDMPGCLACPSITRLHFFQLLKITAASTCTDGSWQWKKKPRKEFQDSINGPPDRTEHRWGVKIFLFFVGKNCVRRRNARWRWWMNCG